MCGGKGRGERGGGGEGERMGKVEGGGGRGTFVNSNMQCFELHLVFTLHPLTY